MDKLSTSFWDENSTSVLRDAGLPKEHLQDENIQFDTNSIFKPIQYLGAKHRPLPDILLKTLKCYAPNTYILDLFSGSTIVSQVFNIKNLNVIANDALSFNSVFAKSLLNVNRHSADLSNFSKTLNVIEKFSLDTRFIEPFEKLTKLEKNYLSKRDTKSLIDLYFGIPQIDKVLFLNGSNQHEQTKYILKNLGKSAIGDFPLIANYYSGTYYSIQQALDLDRLRNSIEYLFGSQQISEWQYSFLLTCLLHVSSKIVYTAGKHFAQPIKKENILKTEVLHKRFYEDRLKNVWNEFCIAISSLLEVAKRNDFSTRNISYSLTMEELITQAGNLPPISVIYADPPYTAQQYSRFYHIPEVIYKYKYPTLQIIDGKPTTGLYPDDKFKSRFCSKREVHAAFEDLFHFTSTLKSSLLLSYSSSLETDTGNIRMISLEEIIELGNKHLKNCTVEISNFDFQYRQLNTTDKIIKTKNDKEILVLFKQTAS